MKVLVSGLSLFFLSSGPLSAGYPSVAFLLYQELAGDGQLATLHAAQREWNRALSADADTDSPREGYVSLPIWLHALMEKPAGALEGLVRPAHDREWLPPAERVICLEMVAPSAPGMSTQDFDCLRPADEPSTDDALPLYWLSIPIHCWDGYLLDEYSELVPICTAGPSLLQWIEEQRQARRVQAYHQRLADHLKFPKPGQHFDWVAPRFFVDSLNDQRPHWDGRLFAGPCFGDFSWSTLPLEADLASSFKSWLWTRPSEVDEIRILGGFFR